MAKSDHSEARAIVESSDARPVTLSTASVLTVFESGSAGDYAGSSSSSPPWVSL